MGCERCNGEGFRKEERYDILIRCRCNPPLFGFVFDYYPESDMNEEETISDVYSCIAHSFCHVVAAVNVDELKNG